MTRNAPTKNDKGEYVGGAAIERTGVKGVKGTRCYSTTCTHQHSRGLVGPTAQGKIYTDEEESEWSDDLIGRKRSVKVSEYLVIYYYFLLILYKIHGQVAMESLKMFAPKKYIEAVTLNAEVTNMPRVGSDENIITPAQQINLAPAVRQEECKGRTKLSHKTSDN